jgi:hypothetical protein
MATQVIGRGRRSPMSVALVALALAFVVFVLATQASSIWATRTGSQIQHAPVQLSLSSKDLKDLSIGAQLPTGCRVKYGCEEGATTLGQP